MQNNRLAQPFGSCDGFDFVFICNFSKVLNVEKIRVTLINRYINIELNAPSIRSVNVIGSAMMSPEDQ